MKIYIVYGIKESRADTRVFIVGAFDSEEKAIQVVQEEKKGLEARQREYHKYKFKSKIWFEGVEITLNDYVGPADRNGWVYQPNDHWRELFFEDENMEGILKALFLN